MVNEAGENEPGDLPWDLHYSLFLIARYPASTLSWTARPFPITITALCHAIGVPDLWSFFSENPDELSEFLDEELEASGNTGSDASSSYSAEQWFSPDEGLKVVSALINSLEADPTQTAPDTSYVLDDLRNMDRILRAAGNAGCLWHLSVDF